MQIDCSKLKILGIVSSDFSEYGLIRRLINDDEPLGTPAEVVDIARVNIKPQGVDVQIVLL